MKITAFWGLSLTAGMLLPSFTLWAGTPEKISRARVMAQASGPAPAPSAEEQAGPNQPVPTSGSGAPNSPGPASVTPAPSDVPPPIGGEAPVPTASPVAAPPVNAMPGASAAPPPASPPPPASAPASPAPPTSAPSATSAPTEAGELPPPRIPKKLHFTAAEIKAECRKFEGKFIASYDRVFKVEGCKRREVISDDDEENPVLRGQRVVSVENLTVAKIPEGPAIGSSPKGRKPSCAKVEGRYIISRASDVFFVERCKKRPFPDWDTYEDHSSKRNKKSQEILELTEEEFLALPLGPEFKSTLNDEYKKMLVTEKGVDILPIDEACKGLNGSYLSYYSKIYKVERCRKHEVDAERFLRRFPNYKLREMSSEQWVSIPTGKALKL